MKKITAIITICAVLVGFAACTETYEPTMQWDSEGLITASETNISASETNLSASQTDIIITPPELPEVEVVYEPNYYGNLSGNIDNMGFAAIQGEWIYYTPYTDSHNNNNELFKIHVDGTQKTKLNNENSHFDESSYLLINVVGDWIYYVFRVHGEENPRYGINSNGIYKMRTDGTEETLLLESPDDKYNRVFVAGDWIYFTYSNYEDDACDLAKMRTDGSEKTIIRKGITHWSPLCVADDWIYFPFGRFGYLNKMRTDGTDETLVFDGINNSLSVVDDLIYLISYSDDEYIYQMRTDGTQKTQIGDDKAFGLVADGEWLYYRESDSNNIYKIRTDGTERTKITDDKCGWINVVGDWIYYDNTEQGATYKIRTDGTQRQAVLD